MKFHQNESNNLLLNNTLKDSSNIINGIQLLNYHIPKNRQFLLNFKNSYLSQNLEEIVQQNQPYLVLLFLRLLISLIPSFLFIMSFYFKQKFKLDSNSKVEKITEMIELQKDFINKKDDEIFEKVTENELKNTIRKNDGSKSPSSYSNNKLASINRKYLLKTFDPIYKRYHYSIM